MDHYKTAIVASGFNVWHSLVESALRPSLATDQKLAEFGCGDGSFAALLSSRYKTHVIAFDISPGNIALAKKAGVDAHELDFTSTDWPIQPHSLDGAFSSEVLEHLIDPMPFLRNVRRALKPGALFCITTPNAFNIRRRVSFLLGRHHDPHLDPTLGAFAEHVRAFSFDMVMRALVNSDFAIVAKLGDRSLRSQAWIGDTYRSLLSSHICLLARARG